MTPRRHSPEFKLKACQRVESGSETQAQICRDLDLSHSVLERWLRDYRELGPAGLAPKSASAEAQIEDRLAEMERLCGQLVFENELLKRALKHSQSVRSTR
jgi:transposase-like protein